MRVAVAMSGGVDSSVAAALLAAEGHDVAGFTLQLWQRGQGGTRHSGCCSLDAVEDARRVANHIGIPYYVLNFERQFRETVIADFEQEYAGGRTPNPCVRCNQWIKFGLLLERARALGFDRLATGHYARIERLPDRFRLMAARDRAKDQSYVLWTLGQGELGATLFPLGDLEKERVRELAAGFGLLVAAKPESQDLCFVAGGDHAARLARRQPAGLQSGPVVDESGRQVGTHAGIATLTIGQRRGMEFSNTSSATPARFVTRIDAESGTVVVGPRESLRATSLRLEQEAWAGGEPPGPGRELWVRIRHHGELVPASLSRHSPGEVRLHRPVYGVAPGQSVVVYDGDEVLGGGVLAEAS
ncbi:MAG: tRNA 2-thiouridine(34) synthase MnmA [Candidatus Dormibacteria bacterium]